MKVWVTEVAQGNSDFEFYEISESETVARTRIDKLFPNLVGWQWTDSLKMWEKQIRSTTFNIIEQEVHSE